MFLHGVLFFFLLGLAGWYESERGVCRVLMIYHWAISTLFRERMGSVSFVALGVTFGSVGNDASLLILAYCMLG